ncbi:MAG: hypothetical protein RJA22_1981 [Verrucomicrobiota bacterium]
MNAEPSPSHAAPAGAELHARTRLIHGPDTVERVGDLALELGARAVLLVTDPGIAQAGHAARVERLLQQAGLGVVVFAEAGENPTTHDVDRCLRVARESGIDFLVGLGGGSAMDTAKGCNFLLTNGGRMQDYWGVGKAAKPMLPLIAIPTTAGTGSECQSAALIADADTHQKMACLDPKAAARVAILDPVLTLSQPPRVTACTGIDALTHAVEAAVTRKRNPFSSLYAHEAFRLTAGSLARVMQHPLDLDARGRMQLGAAFAGLAIEHSMLGAAHSTANPLTAHFQVVHGQAVGLMLPAVMRFNTGDPAALRIYADLAAILGLPGALQDPATAARALIIHVEALLNDAHLPASLADCGVPHGAIPRLAEEAARQWTAQFNPRPVTPQDFVGLYEAAFQPRTRAA